MTTFYLKYRPQKLADLDLVDVRQRLTEILSSSKIPHAFLFTGPKGTGKTSSARILAKSVNCKSKGAEPCNKCDVCQSITSGQAIDLIEIDAASNRGIDDIRSLREKIKLSPSSFKYKVYIIDEVHMLTTEAFNALLKTLEEPPAHAIFVLCTTEPHKLPDTIISRCLQINFRRAKPDEMRQALQRVIKGESLKIAPEVLDLIVQKTDGSFRDGVKILEQLSFAGKKINVAKAQEILGIGQEKEFLKLVLNGQTQVALVWLEKKAESGLDFNLFGHNLLILLRDIWLAKLGLKKLDQDWLTISQAEIKNLINIFSQTAQEARIAVIPQLSFELAVSELGEANLNGSDDSSTSKPESKDQEAESELVEKKETKKREDGLISEPVEPKSQGKSISFDQVKKKWQEILTLLKPKNHSLTALLKATQPLKTKADQLVIEVFYPFHKSQLERERCLCLVEEAACQALAQQVRVSYVLSKNPRKIVKKETLVQVESKPAEEDLADAAEEIFNNGRG